MTPFTKCSKQPNATEDDCRGEADTAPGVIVVGSATNNSNAAAFFWYKLVRSSMTRDDTTNGVWTLARSRWRCDAYGNFLYTAVHGGRNEGSSEAPAGTCSAGQTDVDVKRAMVQARNASKKV